MLANGIWSKSCGNVDAVDRKDSLMMTMMMMNDKSANFECVVQVHHVFLEDGNFIEVQS